MNCGVYQIRNIINGHRYIGSSVNIKKRFANHKQSLMGCIHKNDHLQNAFYKYGMENFSFEILLFTDNGNHLFYEQMLINYLKPEYNISPNVSAPMLGRKQTESAKIKISIGNKGKIISAETREKISLSQKGNKHCLGRKLSEEAKDRIGKANSGRVYSEEARRKIGEASRGNQYCLGKKHTELSKIKMRLVKTGTKHSDETKRKMSIAHKGKKFTEEACKNISVAKYLYWKNKREIQSNQQMRLQI